MLKRLLNIVLAITLVLAVVGVTTSKTYCSVLNKTVSDDCCSGDKDTKGCCEKVIVHQKLSVDHNIVNPEVNVPSVLFFPVTFLYSLFKFQPAELFNMYSMYSPEIYSPPNCTRDIPVLIQNFRI